MAGVTITVPSLKLTFDKKELRKSLRSAGAMVATEARNLVRASVGTGQASRVSPRTNRLYSLSAARRVVRNAGKQHLASLPGQPPANLSGQLASGIGSKVFSRPDEMGVTIKDSVFYSKFLQVGASGGAGNRAGGKGKKKKEHNKRILLPRPFISTALENNVGKITDLVENASLDGITLVQK